MVKIDQETPIWVVTDAGPDSTIADICFQTTLDGLRLQFAGGLSMDDRPVVFTTEEEAHEEARNRLLIRRVASQIRLDRGVPVGGLVRITLRDRDGTLLFEGEVR